MDRTKDLLHKAKDGSTEAVNLLVAENSGLIWNVVRRYTNRGVDYDDLYQIGAIGLIKSIKKFDFSFGVCFSTYAVPMIIGEIKRFLRDDGMIKVSRSLKETAVKINKLKEIEMTATGKVLTIAEIADKLNLSCEEITLALEASQGIDSLQQTVYISNDGSNITLQERISEKVCEEDRIVTGIALTDAVKSLSKKEQSIIKLRYYRDKTQTQTAKILGISQVQVSRIEKKALNKLKLKMDE